MGDTIKARKGLKANIDHLLLGEFGFTTDEERVYIGGNNGNIPLPNAADLSEKANNTDIVKKNEFMNGNFDIHQKGTSIVNPIQGTLADRFIIYPNIVTGTKPTTITHSIEAANGSELIGADSYYRITSSGASVVSGDDSYFNYQNIENGIEKLCEDNGYITISFMARSSMVNKKIGITANQMYGTGGTSSTPDSILGKFITLTNTFKKYTVTLPVTNISGKTFGTDLRPYLMVQFQYAWGLNGAKWVGDTVAENITAGYIDIAQIKVEKGQFATPFIPPNKDSELLACKRFYQEIHVIGHAVDTSIVPLYTNFPVEMRSIPNVTIRNGINEGHIDRFGIGDVVITGYTLSGTSTTSMGYLVTLSAVVAGSTYEATAKLNCEMY